MKASTTIVVTLGEKIEMDADTRAMANRDVAGRFIIVVGDWYLAWAFADYGAFHWHKRTKEQLRIWPVSGLGPFRRVQKKVASPSAMHAQVE